MTIWKPSVLHVCNYRTSAISCILAQDVFLRQAGDFFTLSSACEMLASACDANFPQNNKLACLKLSLWI